jgi:hypothetical protein
MEAFMEWRVGVIPKPLWSVQKGSPQAFRTALNAHMLHEMNGASRAPYAPPLAAPPEQRADPAPHLTPEACQREPAVSSETARLRSSLMAKLNAILADWRTCPQRACRRHHCCTSALECVGVPQREPRSREAEEASFADFQRALKQRSAQFKEGES